jgi:hypothetical protein
MIIKKEKVMKIELHNLRQMQVFFPTIGIDLEYRCLFIVWLNKALYIGKGKSNEAKLKEIIKRYELIMKGVDGAFNLMNSILNSNLKRQIE